MKFRITFSLNKVRSNIYNGLVMCCYHDQISEADTVLSQT